jgi:hypothetical protein
MPVSASVMIRFVFGKHEGAFICDTAQTNTPELFFPCPKDEGFWSSVLYQIDSSKTRRCCGAHTLAQSVYVHFETRIVRGPQSHYYVGEGTIGS